MQSPEEILRTLGEPLVREAFQNLLSNKIPSDRARKILIEFSKKWKDYARPALMILSCRSVGGDPSMVTPAAEALILSSGAFDLHDDIIDQSYERTEAKLKSIMGIHGVEATLLVGDALLIAGLANLTKLFQLPLGDRMNIVVSVIKDGLFELGCAEMDELQLVRNTNVTPEQYLHIVDMKAADVESYTRIGAIIGGGTPSEIESLGRFGRLLGKVTILRDDIEDTFNDRVELASRLTKESLPLPIIFALEDPKCKEAVQKIQESNKEIVDNSQIDEITSLIEKNKGFEKTVKIIEEYLGELKESIKGVREPTYMLSLLYK